MTAGAVLHAVHTAVEQDRKTRPSAWDLSTAKKIADAEVCNMEVAQVPRRHTLQLMTDNAALQALMVQPPHLRPVVFSHLGALHCFCKFLVKQDLCFLFFVLLTKKPVSPRFHAALLRDGSLFTHFGGLPAVGAIQMGGNPDIGRQPKSKSLFYKQNLISRKNQTALELRWAVGPLSVHILLVE